MLNNHEFIMSWRKFMVTLVTTSLIWCLLIGISQPKIVISDEAVEFWAESLSSKITDRTENASGIAVLKKAYRETDTERGIKIIDGNEVLQTSISNIQGYLQARLQAVWNVKDEAQRVYQSVNDTKFNETFASGCEGYFYVNSKSFQLYKDITINTTEPPPPLDINGTLTNDTADTFDNSTQNFLPLYDEWRKYYQVAVSLNASAVHIPTNIYGCAPHLVGNINWTSALDGVFVENHQTMPASWQYFASAQGFMRFYPAAKWKVDGMDMYDARLTEWYTAAAAKPKSVIILLDKSGSMTGLRMEIAKTTVKKIMESLQENDYFNVIAFSNESIFVDRNCSNGTLIQATSRNTRRIARALDSIVLGEIANFSRALTMAFQVLQQAESDDLTGAETNNAIMVVTDGAPEDYAKVFEKYNWNQTFDGQDKTPKEASDRVPNSKWARVFSYLIGDEVTSSNKYHVRWLACANKGYFYHIGTMADVHDYVQDYVRIMARPLVVDQSRHYAWSGVHVNVPLTTENNAYNSHAKSTDWIRLPSDAAAPSLSISVSMPVYDLRGPREEGNLLGVAGTDINIDEILHLIPRHKLGIHGYTFIINNNGFVVYHPQFSPWVEPCDNAICVIARADNPALKDNKPKPDYKNVDITYLEQEEYPEEGRIEKLREEMINGSTGILTATVKKFYNKEFNRVYIQKQTYYYAPIPKTPYSLAIVRVESTDNKVIYDLNPPDFQSFSWCRMTIADWNYCNKSKEDHSLSTPYSLIKEALDPRNSNCDRVLAEAVAYDVNVTRGVASAWIGAQFSMPPVLSRSDNKCDTIQTEILKNRCELKQQIKNAHRLLVFDLLVLGTRSGVTRYQERFLDGSDVEDRQSCTAMHHIDSQSKISIDSDYFQRASLYPKRNVWVFDIKVPKSYHLTGNSSKISLMASKGVYVKDPQRNKNEQSVDLLASAVGLKIQYESLYKLFNLITGFCPDNLDCTNTTCAGDKIDCYLLDDNGYVVMTEREDDEKLGQFFGAIDYQILLDMKDEGLFEEVPVTDYQALCTICKINSESSSASILLDPFRYISKILWWSISKAALSLLEFSLYDWWHCIYYATGLETITPVQNYTTNTVAPQDSSTFIKENSDVLKSILTVSPCHSASRHFISTGSNNLTSNHVSQCLECSESKRSYVATRIPKTNLYLLVLESECTCEDQMQEYCISDTDLGKYGCTDERTTKYRRPPNTYQSSYHSFYPSKVEKTVTENLETCGAASTLYISLPVILINLSLTRWFYR